MYDVYFDSLLLPAAPSKMKLKIKNQNKTVTLINEGEVNLLKKAGLTEISFTAMIPQREYPFCKYPEGFKNAAFFFGEFEKLKTSQAPFRFIVSRAAPDGRLFFDSNTAVSLEDYTIDEDAKNGFDFTVDFKLKQFRAYGVKRLETEEAESPQAPPKASIYEERPAETAPKTKNYTTVPGDTLWAIAKKYYGDGNAYTKIFEANRDKISNPNLIYAGQELTIP